MPEFFITKNGIEKILKCLNTNKAMGPDAIHTRILKELSFELSPVITHFYQKSIDTGVIPNEWKDAHICPLFKKKHSYFANYWSTSSAQA